jgi:hypothetical protein
MGLQFNESINNTGICQQVRSILRVDATQYPNWKIANSCNNYLDFLVGYAIGADSKFQWDSTNHSKLPEGTTALILNHKDYSFLTDEQGNSIITLLKVSLVDSSGRETFLDVIDRDDPEYDPSSFGITAGTPTTYDKIADNIIRLDNKPDATAVATYSLKFYFQRTPYYYVSTDTTRTSGFSPILDRGFIIESAYDGALTLGLKNIQALMIERQIEREKAENYFSIRNKDEVTRIIPASFNYE